jgi:hypothetical protein
MLGTLNLSPYLDSMDMAVESDQADTTTFGTTWKSSLLGFTSGKVDYSGLYDPTVADLPTLFLSALPGNLTYCPGGGATIGDAARLVSATETSYAESSPVGGVVAIKGSFDASGSVGFGNVLHPLGEDTNTTVGAERDDATATATGWTAHLHVVSLDGGTWTIKLEDAAASNTYSDLTGGAFTGVAAAGSQRLQSAAATTALRRYVRYTATRAGGGAGDGITFFLAYARNR